MRHVTSPCAPLLRGPASQVDELVSLLFREAPMTTATIAPALRRLYLVRFAFALVWAVLLLLTASSITPVSAVLLVLYPVVDVAAAVVDGRSSRDARLSVNIAVSALAAVGLAVAVTSGIPAVLR